MKPNITKDGLPLFSSSAISPLALYMVTWFGLTMNVLTAGFVLSHTVYTTSHHWEAFIYSIQRLIIRSVFYWGRLSQNFILRTSLSHDSQNTFSRGWTHNPQFLYLFTKHLSQFFLMSSYSNLLHHCQFNAHSAPQYTMHSCPRSTLKVTA